MRMHMESFPATPRATVDAMDAKGSASTVGINQPSGMRVTVSATAQTATGSELETAEVLTLYRFRVEEILDGVGTSVLRKEKFQHCLHYSPA